MSEPARKVATYQDVIDAPEGYIAEILSGELHLSPRPGYEHQASVSGMSVDLGSSFGRQGGGRPGGWVLLYEPELWLGQPDPTTAVLVPDLAGWRRERFAPPEQHGHTLVPDWVCEVLSPGARNHRRDRLIKMDAYHQARVPWYWIVDPEHRLVEVYKHQEQGYLRAAAATGYGDARLLPFDAVALPIGQWWPPRGEDEDDDEPLAEAHPSGQASAAT